jgi:hypothetical protein
MMMKYGVCGGWRGKGGDYIKLCIFASSKKRKYRKAYYFFRSPIYHVRETSAV